MHIEQSIALVTGASRGIGRAIAEALLDRGAKRVYAAARDLGSLEGLLARDRARVTPLRLDITLPEEVARAAQAAGDVNLLVNNAGVLASYSLLKSPIAEIERDVQTNFLGTLSMARAFTPVLERQGGGAIINLLTLLSLAPMPGLGGYAASKAALYSLTQALRAELKPRRIAVHGVFPGAVDTDMIRSLQMPKTPPQAVAAALLDGVERGDEDIFPDPMSRELAVRWAKNPKDLEQQFAGM